MNYLRLWGFLWVRDAGRRDNKITEHGRRFIVLELQYGRRDVECKRSITYIVQLKTRNEKISTNVYSRGSNLEVIDTRVLEYLEKLRGKDLYTFRRAVRWFFFPLTHIAFLVSVTVGLRKGEVGNLCSRLDRLCEESLGREAAKSGAEWGEDALKFWIGIFLHLWRSVLVRLAAKTLTRAKQKQFRQLVSGYTWVPDMWLCTYSYFISPYQTSPNSRAATCK